VTYSALFISERSRSSADQQSSKLGRCRSLSTTTSTVRVFFECRIKSTEINDAIRSFVSACGPIGIRPIHFTQNKAVGIADSAPGCATALANAGVDWGRNGRSMTSHTKPEVHTILRCHQRRTEPRPRLTTCRPTEHFAKFGHLAFG